MAWSSKHRDSQRLTRKSIKKDEKIKTTILNKHQQVEREKLKKKKLVFSLGLK